MIQAARSLNPYREFAKSESRWAELAAADGCTVSKAKSSFIYSNPFKIVIEIEINKFLKSITPLSDKYVYVGVSSRSNEFERITQHSRIHGRVNFKIIAEYDNRFRGFGAEGVGIAYLKSIEHLVKGVLNRGEGWEKEALAGQGQTQKIYVYSTTEPFKKIQARGEESKGLLRQSATPVVRDPRVYWCYHCQKNLQTMTTLANHMELHARTNYKCSICDEYFICKETKIQHEELHGIVLRCPNMNCDMVLSLTKMRDTHFKVSISKFDELSNKCFFLFTGMLFCSQQSFYGNLPGSFKWCRCSQVVIYERISC